MEIFEGVVEGRCPPAEKSLLTAAEGTPRQPAVLTATETEGDGGWLGCEGGNMSGPAKAILE